MAAKKDIASLSLEEAIAERADIHEQVNALRERKVELTKHIAQLENEAEAEKSAGFGTTIGLGPEQA